jgi:tRNA pseudouridine55 synthase
LIENGVLNIDKPAGWTSHDVVSRARKLLKIKKIGHAGTLDPDATGVLILCIGKATKLAEYLMGMDKEYEAVMRLGETTSTQDASGEILEKKEWDGIKEEELIGCFSRFTGEIAQIPSAYSAIKIGGIPSYQRARKGEEVNIPVRKVKIFRIDYLGREGANVSLKIHCSKGTYIRTLCHDMWGVLGPGAHVSSLRRTRSGKFSVEDSISLEKLTDYVESDQMEREIYGMDEAMNGFPSILLDEADEKKTIHGTPLVLKEGEGGALLTGSLVCLKSQSGNLVALGVFEGEKTKRIRIEKVLIQ